MFLVWTYSASGLVFSKPISRPILPLVLFFSKPIYRPIISLVLFFSKPIFRPIQSVGFGFFEFMPILPLFHRLGVCNILTSIIKQIYLEAWSSPIWWSRNLRIQRLPLYRIPFQNRLSIFWENSSVYMSTVYPSTRVFLLPP